VHAVMFVIHEALLSSIQHDLIALELRTEIFFHVTRYPLHT
jgi:hypothetical protein